MSLTRCDLMRGIRPRAARYFLVATRKYPKKRSRNSRPDGCPTLLAPVWLCRQAFRGLTAKLRASMRATLRAGPPSTALLGGNSRDIPLRFISSNWHSPITLLCKNEFRRRKRSGFSTRGCRRALQSTEGTARRGEPWMASVCSRDMDVPSANPFSGRSAQGTRRAASPGDGFGYFCRNKSTSPRGGETPH